VQLPQLPELPEIFDRRWVRVVTLCAIALALVLLVTFYVVKYKEASTAGCECEGIVDQARLTLYNPFRDRAPERLADSAMQTIQQHQCQRFPGPAIFCDEEDHLTILNWKLTGVAENDDQTSAIVRFWVVRSAKAGDSFEDPLLMTLQVSGKSWTIKRVDTYY
jgi:hypothetical protein